MPTTEKITPNKLRKLIAGSRACYLYSNGDLVIWRQEAFKGKAVDFRYLVKGYVAKVEIRDYQPSKPVDLPVRVVMGEDVFAALTLARPERVSIAINSQSEGSKPHGLAQSSVRFTYGPGAIKAEFCYLAKLGDPSTPYLISSPIKIQVGAEYVPSAEFDQGYTLDDAPAAEPTA